MRDVLFSLPGIALTVFCWGMYGSVLHKGQHDLGGDRLKPLICVGCAYFVIAIIVPTTLLGMQGKLGGGWSFGGIWWSSAAGCAGALGALGIILALTAGGKPVYVMPIVFGGAPIINVLASMYFTQSTWASVVQQALFIAGMILVILGAVMVLLFQPKATPAAPTAKPPVAEKAEVEPAPAEDRTQVEDKSS